MIDDIGEILAKAREILETNGWVQDHFVTDDGICLVTALNLAQGGFRLQGPTARSFLRKYLHGTGVQAWNDAPGRTYEEVIQLLKDAEREATQ